MKYVTFNDDIKYQIEDLTVFNDITSVPMDMETANKIFNTLKDMTISTIDFSSDDGMFSGHYDNLTFRKTPSRVMDEEGNIILHVYTRDMTLQDRQYAILMEKYKELEEKLSIIESEINTTKVEEAQSSSTVEKGVTDVNDSSTNSDNNDQDSN